MNTMTAEQLFRNLKQLPSQERNKFFTLVGQHAFKDENFTHDEVFGDLGNDNFTAKEAAAYLEVSMPTFRRFVNDGRIKVHAEIGRSQLFAPKELQAFKQARKAARG